MHFDRAPEPGDLLLRHDVDLSLDAALRLAEVEAEAGVTATYFLMTESVFYNLASSEGATAIARLRELGHRIGLHAVYPHARLDERFDPVVAWHNPEPEVHVGARRRSRERHAEGVLRPGDLPFGLEPPLALRLPARGAPSRFLPWLQLLTHPEIWVHAGATMGETMHAMLDAERERRVGQLAADRIDLA